MNLALDPTDLANMQCNTGAALAECRTPKAVITVMLIDEVLANVFQVSVY